MQFKSIRIVLAAAALAACGDSSTPATAPEPLTPQPAPAPPVVKNVRITIDTTFAEVLSTGVKMIYLDVGLPRQLTAIAADSAGNPITSSTLTWAIADPTVATIGTDGTLTPIKAGSTRLAVASGTLTDTATVKVSPRLSGSTGTTNTVLTADVPLLPPRGYVPQFDVSSVSGGTTPYKWYYALDGAAELPTYPDRGVLPAASIAVGNHVVRVAVKDRAGATISEQQSFLVQSPARNYNLRFLGSLGGDDSKAESISQGGIVVGSAKTSTGERHAVVWENGVIRDLVPDLANSTARGINSLGQVVGCEGINDSAGFLISNGRRTEFPDCAGAINDRGTIAFHGTRVFFRDSLIDFASQNLGFSFALSGKVNKSDGLLSSEVPFHGNCGHIIMCPSSSIRIVFPPTYPRTISSLVNQAYDFNDAGDFLVPFAPCTTACFVLDGVVLSEGQSSALRFSGVRARNTCYGEPASINNTGTVAGLLRTAWDDPADCDNISQPRVFLWDWKAGHVYRIILQDPNWQIDFVAKINDAGQIAAHGHNIATGQKGAVLLEPAG